MLLLPVLEDAAFCLCSWSHVKIENLKLMFGLSFRASSS